MMIAIPVVAIVIISIVVIYAGGFLNKGKDKTIKSKKI